MALPRSLFVVFLASAWPLLFFCLATEAGEVGVNYGRIASNLRDPPTVVKLLKDNGITMVRLYDTDDTVLTSLANTGIKVSVMMHNENIAAAASDTSYALQWVKSNVASYLPSTQIHGIAVGNEVFHSSHELNSQLVPAMRNVHGALKDLGLADTVKVTTPVAFDALKESFPPSAARFKDEITDVMKELLEFQAETGSCFAANIYPFFAYLSDPAASARVSSTLSDTNSGGIPLDYALGNSNPGVYDDGTGLMYYSLLDAQIDATHHAIEAVGARIVPKCPPYVTECGWPHRGRLHPHLERPRRRLLATVDRRFVPKCASNLTECGWGTGGSPPPPPGRPRRVLLDTGDGSNPASIPNAKAFNNNLINRVLSGNTGTPYRPHADMNVYIFALFNENGKSQFSDDIENNFGLFDPESLQKIYDFSFQGPGKPPAPPPESSNAAVGDVRLQAALDYACGHGADCSAIQPGGSCFDPDTKLAHASYAVNSYYQNNHRAPVACDFNGAGSVVYQKPADTCGVKPMSWCVANAAVGNTRLQTALDYACANGADCSALQPGGSCFEPNTMVAHASYAFNSYYQNKNRASGTCDFNGAGSVVYQQPANTCGATAVTWCVANSAVSDARLQTALDYACANGADCSAIQARGACFNPNTKVAHASYAFNSYYQRKSRAPRTCDFSGAGSIVSQAPKFGNCVLPSNG